MILGSAAREVRGREMRRVVNSISVRRRHEPSGIASGDAVMAAKDLERQSFARGSPSWDPHAGGSPNEVFWAESDRA